MERNGYISFERGEIESYCAGVGVDGSRENVRWIIMNQAAGKVRMTALENLNTGLITHIRATDAHLPINLRVDREYYQPTPKECALTTLSLHTGVSWRYVFILGGGQFNADCTV